MSLYKLGALWVTDEATFGTDPGTGSDMYLRILGALDRGPLVQASVEDDSTRQRMADRPRVMTHTSDSSLSVKTNLHGYLASLPVGAPSTPHTDAKLLQYALGGLVSGGYAAALSSGSTTTVLKVASAASFVAGQAVAVDVSATATPSWQVGWIQQVNTGTTPHEITLLQALPAAPAAGKVLYGSHTCYQKDDWGTAASATLRWRGHSAADHAVLCGCRPKSCKIDLADRGLPELTMEFMGANLALAGTGGAPATQTWAYPGPQALIGGRCTWGADMATGLALSGLSIDFGMTVVQDMDPAGAHGVGGYTVTNRKPKVTFKAVRDFARDVTAFLSQTPASFVYTWGSQPGKMVSICVPAAAIAEASKPTDMDGRWGSELTLYAQDYTSDVGVADSADSLLRVAFL